MKKKLIEVALPLEAINLESAREKSIRHGHPSTLHLWWARRPLAACRAVLWASLVDDPSSWPDRFPTEADQERERQRLFDILGRIEIQQDKKGNTKPVVRGLVSWDDVNDPNSGVLEAAQREIARCLAWERGEEPPTDPAAVRDYIARYAPPVYDPFAGGGSIPLEAQRLGLEAHASDLNPVAVLINKALIEIPPKFRDLPPVNPVDCPHPPAPSPKGRGGVAGLNRWYGAQGLAADVRFYGAWMRDEAFQRIGHLYPKVALTPQPPLPKGEGETSALIPQPLLSKGEGETSALTPQPLLSKGEGETSALTPRPPLPKGEGETSALTPQPLLSKGEGETSALTPQPPLPRGEGEIERWEIPLATQKKMQEVARQLRRQSTPSEAILWEALRNRRLAGRKFRRQHPIGTFVVDFFCQEEALIVEVDGPIHEHQPDLDRQRQELLEGLGLRFVRLSSHLVETNLPLALEQIRSDFLPSPAGIESESEGQATTPLPSPSGIESESEGQATVIAWLWARTVKCPNPACGCAMPLVRSFQLSTKKGKEAWVEPVIERTDAPLTPQPPLPRGEGELNSLTPQPPLPWGEGELNSLTPQPPLPRGEGELNSLTPQPPLPRGEGELNSLTPQPPLPRGEGEKTQNPLPQGEGRVRVKFVVKSGEGKAPEGTVDRKGARCIACGTPVPLDHVRQEGRAGRMGAQLMAIVAEGPNGRVYLAPTAEQEAIANSAQPTWKPDTELSTHSQYMAAPRYGMTKHADLFTPRQLVALTTFSDLVAEAREKAIADAIAAGLPNDDVPLAEGGTGARAYGEAISVYLGMALSRLSDICNSLCMWENTKTQVRHLFTRQAIPMLWDYAEPNIFSNSAGNFEISLGSLLRVVEKLDDFTNGQVAQHDATAPHPHDTTPKLISTDPPYYSAVPYADLSDFFYVWLRRSLGSIYPNIFNTVLVPKAQEMVADHFRHGSKDNAKEFFEASLVKVFQRANHLNHPDYPVTVYYALKQTEEDPSPPDPLSQKGRGGVGSPHPPAPSPQGRGGVGSPHPPAPSPQGRGGENSEPSPQGRGQGEGGRASTGWETILEGLIQSNFSIDGTWPLRTELANRMRGQASNALASSIVLVCRPRPADAPKATRRQFLSELQQELPKALHALQQGSIAPVDLAQASIGPGMAIYSRYAAILENDGSPLTVRTALQLINQYLDEYLSEQEGEFDSDTRWAITWFLQHQFEPGPYGEAETLSKARNTSVQGMVEAGILEAKAGKVRLLKRETLTLPASLSPGAREGQESESPSPSGRGVGVRVSDWLLTQALIHQLDTQGEMGAAELLSKLGEQGAIARDLAYRLYSLCDKKGWTQEAIAYNSLVISWPEIDRLASEARPSTPIQTNLF